MGTQRYQPTQRDDEDALTRAIITLASQNGRYGYCGITAELHKAGWRVGKDRVERIWRREGLKVPQKQKPRGRLWPNDGSCVRLRPGRRNHVGRTASGAGANFVDALNQGCLRLEPNAQKLHLDLRGGREKGREALLPSPRPGVRTTPDQ